MNHLHILKQMPFLSLKCIKLEFKHNKPLNKKVCESKLKDSCWTFEEVNARPCLIQLLCASHWEGLGHFPADCDFFLAFNSNGLNTTKSWVWLKKNHQKWLFSQHQQLKEILVPWEVLSMCQGGILAAERKGKNSQQLKTQLHETTELQFYSAWLLNERLGAWN